METITFKMSDQLVEELRRIYRFLPFAMPIWFLLFEWFMSRMIPPFFTLPLFMMIGAVIMISVLMVIIGFINVQQIEGLRQVEIVVGPEGIERRKRQTVEFFPYIQFERLITVRKNNGSISHLNIVTSKSRLTLLRLNDMDHLAALLEARISAHVPRKTQIVRINGSSPVFLFIAVLIALGFVVAMFKGLQGNIFSLNLITFIIILLNSLYMFFYRPMSRVWGASYRWRENLFAVFGLIAIGILVFLLPRVFGAYPSTHPCNSFNRHFQRSSCIATFAGGPHAFFLPNQSMLVLNEYETIWLQPVPDRLFYFPDLLHHDDFIEGYSLSADGQRLASWSLGVGKDVLWLWDVSNQVVLHEQQMENVEEVALNADGTVLAVSGVLGPTYLWRTVSWQPMAVISDTGSVAFSPDGRLFATTPRQQGGIVDLWQTDDLNYVRPLTVPEGKDSSATSITFSPDSKWIAAATYDDIVYVWQVSDGSWQFTWSEQARIVTPPAFSPTGDILALGLIEGYVQLWSLKDGTKLATIPLGGTLLDQPESLTFSSDGAFLAIATFNGVMVFEMAKLLP